jgi:hypothetical protein
MSAREPPAAANLNKCAALPAAVPLNDDPGIGRANRSVSRMSPPASKPSPQAPKGVYSNYFEIGHTAFEFVVDFGQAYAGKAVVPCHTRIVTTPVYARVLLEVLQKAVAEYDKAFGPLRK